MLKMAEIRAEMVKELREKTGAGMLDCKNALTETQGDLEKAIEVLRKKGIAAAGKKAGRIASEGLVHIHREKNRASIVEVNCETDFVGKTPDFQDFVKQLAKHAHDFRPADLEGFLRQKLAGSEKSVDLAFKELVAKIGENINLRRFFLLEASEGEQLGSYIHMGSKIGAMVKVKGNSAKISEDVLKDFAMHVAASAPRYLRASEIPQEVKEKEKEIYRAQMKDSGKPAEILEKIIEGKLGKFANEVCLEDQIFIRDPDGKKTVGKLLKEMDPTATLVSFIRYQVGEGMAKKEEDFAAEVAKQVRK